MTNNFFGANQIYYSHILILGFSCADVDSQPVQKAERNVGQVSAWQMNIEASQLAPAKV